VTRGRACVVCGALLFGGSGARCAECRRDWRRRYDEARPEHHRFYASLEWRHLAAEVRAAATRCHWCLKPTTRLVADHVIPLDQRPDLALERSNLVAACLACNTRRGRNARLPDIEAAS
jgi:5-methylcytosine-specific restriction endonuclease McrA